MKILITILSLTSVLSAQAMIFGAHGNVAGDLCMQGGGVLFLEGAACEVSITTTSLPTVLLQDASVVSDEDRAMSLILELEKNKTPETQLVAKQIGSNVESVQAALMKILKTGEIINLENIESNL